jgi:DNA-binding transcriptional ArsR family regulator
MAKYKELDSTFAALADPTRRAIMENLMEGKKSVTDIAKPFHFALPTISRHISVLEKANLVTREIDGRTHYLSLNARQLRQAVEYLEQYREFWTETFDQLDAFLRGDDEA